MSVGLQLLLSTVLVAVPPPCSWAHPGANPYRGDPVHALDDLDMPSSTRRGLREAMRAHRYTDVATISRDDIVGSHGDGYGDLREMHSGRGQVCHGAVDRSAWAPTRRERGLVYCAGEVCVIVPTICNNVSLVTRKPVRAAAPDDAPIDIEPAAGPAAAPDEAPADAAADALAPGEFLPASDDAAAPAVAAGPGDLGSSGGFPGGGVPIGGGTGGGTGGGGGPGVPTTSPVPELPAWALLLAGLAALAAASGQRQARSRNGCACAGQGEAKNAATIAASTS